MEKARYNTELYSNLRGPLNNVKPSNFWGSHQIVPPFFYLLNSAQIIAVATATFRDSDVMEFAG